MARIGIASHAPLPSSWICIAAIPRRIDYAGYCFGAATVFSARSCHPPARLGTRLGSALTLPPTGAMTRGLQDVFARGGGTGRREALEARGATACGFDPASRPICCSSQGAVSWSSPGSEDLSPVVRRSRWSLTPDRREGRAVSRLHLRLRTVKLKGTGRATCRALVARYWVGRRREEGRRAKLGHGLDPRGRSPTPARTPGGACAGFESGSWKRASPFKERRRSSAAARSPRTTGPGVTRIDATTSLTARRGRAHR